MTRTKNKGRISRGKAGMFRSSPGFAAVVPVLILAAFCLLMIVFSLVWMILSR